jgi:hypothetical protein
LDAAVNKSDLSTGETGEFVPNRLEPGAVGTYLQPENTVSLRRPTPHRLPARVVQFVHIPRRQAEHTIPREPRTKRHVQREGRRVPMDGRRRSHAVHNALITGIAGRTWPQLVNQRKRNPPDKWGVRSPPSQSTLRFAAALPLRRPPDPPARGSSARWRYSAARPARSARPGRGADR